MNAGHGGDHDDHENDDDDDDDDDGGDDAAADDDDVQLCEGVFLCLKTLSSKPSMKSSSF